MSSLIPGYEYDVFISYRQKDNKGERWVSEFVEALKIELESTFKEEISVYFDINPHNGLLETHDVDESLKQKLKCLIFIPVISRTYCDPKSFAWEHEFKTFVDQASNDQFGLKVKLSSGNVASRVLPVRIHELDNEDIKLCELLTDGVLRGVEFIYKEPGVNRPLSQDDDENKNLNKTKYRNQLNKVANAINEIIRGLKYNTASQADEIKTLEKNEIAEITEKKAVLKTLLAVLKRLYHKNPIIVILSIFLLLIGTYLIFKPSDLQVNEKSLALIPLRISNKDTSLRDEGDYFIEALTNKLNLVRSLNVKPTISIRIFNDSGKSLEDIRRALGTNYVIDGNIRREGNNIKIWIELSETRKNKLLWSGTFLWEKNKAASITKELTEIITAEMNVRLTPEEEKLIMNEPSRFPVASQNYISANIIMRDAWSYFNYGPKMLDSVSFMSAIESYNKAINEDSLFALAYAKRAQAITWGIYDRQLDSSYLSECRYDIDKALEIDKDLPETQIALGLYYYFCEINFDKALFYFNNAAMMDPGNYQPLYYQSLVYRKMGKWMESQTLINKVIKLNPQEALFLTNIGLSFDYLHKFDSAIIYHQKAIDIVPGWPAAHVNKIQSLILRDGKTTEARSLLNETVKKTGDPVMETRILLSIYEGNYETALKEALNSNPSDFNFGVSRFLYLARICYLSSRFEDTKAFCDSALADLGNSLKENPYSPELHGYTGMAYAYIGDWGKAVEEGEKSIILATKNKMLESDMKVNLAIIYLIINEPDKASSLLAYLLNSPSFLSREQIQLDPIWKPLLNKPEYRQMILKKT